MRNDNIGDVVLTTPAIEALRKHYPDAYIAILVAEYARESIDGNPHLDKIYSYQKAKHSDGSKLISWWRQYKVIREIRKDKFDLAIGIRSIFSPSQGWLVFASGAPLRLGHYPKKRRHFSFCYNIYANETPDKTHEIIRSLDILRKINVDIEKKDIFFFVPEEEKKRVREFLERNNLKKGKRLVCLHISGRIEEGRWWDPVNYISLSDSLMERGDIDLALNWSPKDAALSEEVISKIKSRPVVFESKGIKSLGAFLRECDLLITLQGGAMHIAAALKTPTIAIFDKTDPDVWHPWGEDHIVLKRGNNPNLVTVKDVIDAVNKMFGEKP
ncbi:MAG: glycosyltransferase family 9 protein [Nitrospirae bacterium]|nr:glycosyltransferase family 9 protein [Nitrospirota bacterium]